MQNIFDTVVAAVIAQGARSQDEIGWCMYRGPNGLKCAAGHLIPDDRYDPRMEGNVIREVNNKFELGLDANINLIQALQFAHDNASPDDFVNEFTNSARDVAQDFNLEFRF